MPTRTGWSDGHRQKRDGHHHLQRLLPLGDLEMPDYEAALSSSTRDAYSYDTLNGESVLAYTLLAPSVDDSNVPRCGMSSR